MAGLMSGEPDRPRDRLEVQPRVARVEAGREDALVEEMQRVLLGVADGAHDLVPPAGHAQAGQGAVGLRGGHGGIGVGPPRFQLPRGFPREPPRALDIPKEVGTGVLDGLVAADGPPALHAHAGMLHAQLEHALGGADHLGAPGEGAQTERGGQQRPAAPRRAEHVVRACLHPGELELEELVAGHAVERARGDAVAVHREQERGRPGGGPTEHDHVGRHVRVRDEELASGEAAGGRDGQGQRIRVEAPRLLEHGERADPLAHGQGGEQLLDALRRAALLEERARRLLEELLRRREQQVHQARARGSAGRPSARTAMVVRWISEVPPASVWPQLVWYWCSISPRSRAQREPARSTPYGPSSSMPIESTRCPSSSAMILAADTSPVAGRPRSMSQAARWKSARRAAISVAAWASRRRATASPGRTVFTYSTSSPRIRRRNGAL